MQEKNIFQTVPEHEKHQLSRSFVDVARPCSCVEPHKEGEKLSFVYAQVCVSDLAKLNLDLWYGQCDVVIC